MQYRFCYLGPDGQVWRYHNFRAESDAAALEVAWELFKLTVAPEHGFMLLQGERRIHLHDGTT